MVEDRELRAESREIPAFSNLIWGAGQADLAKET